MAYALVILDTALDEIEAARAAIGASSPPRRVKQFGEEMEAALALAVAYPRLGHRYGTYRRRRSLPHFDYSIWFLVFPDREQIVVDAVLHDRDDPHRWPDDSVRK